MLETLIKSFLVGFGIYSLVLFFQNKKLVNFDKSTCFITSIFGLSFIFVFFLNIILEYQSVVKEMEISQLDAKIFGQYWLGYWLSLILVIPIQLLWIKKVRENSWLRLLIGISQIISIEYFITFFSSFHRDYLPSSWSISLGSGILSLFWDIVVFASISILWYYTRLKLEEKRN